MKNYSTGKIINLNARELSDFVEKYYQKNIQDKQVINLHKKIPILFNRIGRNKTARPTMNKRRAVIVINILELLRDAKYLNFNTPKPEHVKKYNAVGILNFRFKCLIDNTKAEGRISVIQSKDLKFQYSLTFSKTKNG